MQKRSLAIAAALLALPAAAAAPGPRVAVLELRNKLSTADRRDLDASYLTDLARAGLLRAAPALDLMSRENVLVLLQASGKTLEECEGECEVDTARRLGADLVVSGDLLRFGSAYRISLRLHEVHTSRLLGAAQASGATADEVASDISVAMAQLAGTLGPVREEPPPARPAVSWWRQYYLRDAAQLMAGFGYDTVGPTPRFGVRAFGVELRAAPSGHFQETIAAGGTTTSEFHAADWSGWVLGISPLSFSTGVYGEATGLEFVVFEPFLGYEFGTLKKTNNAASVNVNLSGIQFGTRAYLKLAVSRAIGLCLGAEFAYSTVNWRDVAAPGTTATFGGPPLVLAGFAGLALTLGSR